MEWLSTETFIAEVGYALTVISAGDVGTQVMLEVDIIEARGSGQGIGAILYIVFI